MSLNQIFPQPDLLWITIILDNTMDYMKFIHERVNQHLSLTYDNYKLVAY